MSLLFLEGHFSRGGTCEVTEESVEEKDSWPRESVCNGKGMSGGHVVRCHFHIYSVSPFSLPMAPSMAGLRL